jgi:nicotinate-nucleotide--dimethylbenzimidazole phosphoribosyltransferase
MTNDQCLQALLLGVGLADRAQAAGVRVLGTGDMGIGNTTPSTALYCAYLGLDPASMTGPGTGLDARHELPRSPAPGRQRPPWPPAMP